MYLGRCHLLIILVFLREGTYFACFTASLDLTEERRLVASSEIVNNR